jgi:hypothetical protein
VKDANNLWHCSEPVGSRTYSTSVLDIATLRSYHVTHGYIFFNLLKTVRKLSARPCLLGHVDDLAT